MLLVDCLLVLQRQVVLKNFMLVCLIVHGAHQILKATNVNLAVQYALQIFEVHLFGQNRFKLGLVGLSVQGLGHRCLVCLVTQLCFDFNKLRIDFLLEA